MERRIITTQLEENENVLENHLRPQYLSEYIGQEKAKEILKVYIEAAKKLYIRVPSRSSREYAKVVNLLGIFDGDMPVLLYLTDTKQYLRVPRHLYASGHPLLFKELERLVGTDNIATK